MYSNVADQSGEFVSQKNEDDRREVGKEVDQIAQREAHKQGDTAETNEAFNPNPTKTDPMMQILKKISADTAETNKVCQVALLLQLLTKPKIRRGLQMKRRL